MAIAQGAQRKLALLAVAALAALAVTVVIRRIRRRLTLHPIRRPHPPLLREAAAAVALAEA